MYYFYCPKCGYEDHVKTYPRGTVANVRDGYGIPILHYTAQTIKKRGRSNDKNTI